MLPDVNTEPTVSILLTGRPVTALLDTGCAQTLGQSQDFQKELWTEDTVAVCCIHGNESALPTAEVYIEVSNQPYLMKVGIVTKLQCF